MTDIEDWLDHPLEVLNVLFERTVQKCEGDVSRIRDGFGVSTAASVLLNDSRVPRFVKDGDNPSVCFFQGMVLNMLDPEFYLAVAKDTHSAALLSGRYTNNIKESAEPAGTLADCLAQRQTLHCVPLPGQSSWMKEQSQPSPPPRKTRHTESTKSANNELSQSCHGDVTEVVLYDVSSATMCHVIDVVGIVEPSSSTIHALCFNSYGSRIPSPVPLPLRPQDIHSLRDAVVDWIARLLRGDRVVAEYLLMFFVADGKFTLNVSNSNGEECRSLDMVMKELLAFTMSVRLDAESLDSHPLVPQQDAEGVLHPGALQVAGGTHVLVDETHLQPGQFSPLATRQLQAFRSLLVGSGLPCVLPYFSVDIPLELAICIVSSEGKSILHQYTSAVVPICSSVASSSCGAPSGSIEGMRSYLSWVKWVCPTKWDNGITDEQVIRSMEDAFVRSRAAVGAVLIRGETLQWWVSLARWRAMSFGETGVSMKRWSEVLELENERLRRLGIKSNLVG